VCTDWKEFCQGNKGIEVISLMREIGEEPSREDKEDLLLYAGGREL